MFQERSGNNLLQDSLSLSNEPMIINGHSWEGTPYNMSSVTIAPFLSPKRVFHDQMFEVSVDDALFISRPTTLTNPEKAHKEKKKVRWKHDYDLFTT